MQSARPIVIGMKDGSDKPLPFMRAYQPRKAAIEAIPDLKRLWKSPDNRSPRTGAGSRANGYPRRFPIRRHASSNNRRQPHVENTRSAPAQLDLKHP